MDLDDASNGMFLRVPDDTVSAMSRHEGYHGVYNEVVESRLDLLDPALPIPTLERRVADLQRKLRKIQESGNAQLYVQESVSGRPTQTRQQAVDRIRSTITVG